MRFSSVAALVSLLTVSTATAVASAAPPTRVGGYFCDSSDDHVAFLTRRALGENAILAANAVNKVAGRQTCADYISVEGIPAGEKVVLKHGIAYKMYRVIFLPEKVERWTGRMVDAFDVVAEKQDI